MEELDVSKYKMLRSIPRLGQLKKLRTLYVVGCNEMLELSIARNLMLLKKVHAYNCLKLWWDEGELEQLHQTLNVTLVLII